MTKRLLLDAGVLRDLVERAAQRDVVAYEFLITHFNPVVRSVCASAGLTRHEVEDVVQGVWLQVVQHLEALREPERFGGWIATIARNESLSVVRHKIKDREAQGKAERHTDVPAPDQRILDEERRSLVRRAMTSLDERCRELLFLLSASPPMSYVDIASTMHMPVASIGPTRGRCLEKLRRLPAIVAIWEHP